MKIFTWLFSTLLLFNVHGQNKVLQLDGNNDFVNLGPTSGNNVRTIEFWFKPATNISSSLNTFKTMIGRNTGPLGSGDHYEFGIFFSRLNGHSGEIAFSINDNQSNNYTIYSNSNQWSSNQWYHIAAVLDSSTGTKMFIDGVLQNQTSIYTGSTDTSRFYTAIGRYGDFSRYFDGRIDEVKFHSTAIYSNNFTPTCNNGIIGDAGNWDFDGVQLGRADDLSGKNNAGLMLNGASKTLDNVCPVAVGINDNQLINKKLIVNVYPNPVRNNLTISISEVNQTLPYQISNMLGQTLKEGNLNQILSTVKLENFQNGIYFLRVWKQGEVVGTYKFIKE